MIIGRIAPGVLQVADLAPVIGSVQAARHENGLHLPGLPPGHFARVLKLLVGGGGDGFDQRIGTPFEGFDGLVKR